MATSDLGTWAYPSATPLCKTEEAGLERAAVMIRDQDWGVWNMARIGKGLAPTHLGI